MIHRLLVFFLLLTGAHVCAQAQPPGTLERFRVADEAFRHRADMEKAELALKLYREAFAKDPEDKDAAWRLSMAAHFFGMRFVKDSDEKAKLFAEGRDAGRAALKKDPDCAACHFWTAINMALYGNEVSVFKMLFTLKDIQSHLKETLRLEPCYAYGGAHRVLGKIEQKLPGILGGSNRRAREYFEAAVATCPDEPMNYLFLAQLLKDEFDEPKAAVEIAAKGAALPEPAPDRVESVEALGEVKSYLLELKKKLEPETARKPAGESL